MVLLGRITGAHGIRGEVRITSFTAAPGDITAYGDLRDQRGNAIAIAGLRPLKGATFAAKLQGVLDRNTAETLKGTDLYIERAKLPDPDEEEWYHADLIGLDAVTPDGDPFGKIIAVQDFGAGDLLEIAPDHGKKTQLIPFTKSIVPVVDVVGGRVVVDPPEEMDDA